MGVPDLSGMIGGMLSDPETLKNILNIASGLKNAGIFSQKEQEVKEDEKKEKISSYEDATTAYTEKNSSQRQEKAPRDWGVKEDTSDFKSSFSSSPLGLPPFSGKQRKEKGAKDQRSALLLALRPYLSKDRQEKIDGILQIFAFLELAEEFGGVLGGDRGRGGGN